MAGAVSRGRRGPPARGGAGRGAGRGGARARQGGRGRVGARDRVARATRRRRQRAGHPARRRAAARERGEAARRREARAASDRAAGRGRRAAPACGRNALALAARDGRPLAGAGGRRGAGGARDGDRGGAVSGAVRRRGRRRSRSWWRCWRRCWRSSCRWRGGLRRAGAAIEERFRDLFMRKIPRLGDRYFQSRPVSDMAERAHLVHKLRSLPTLAGDVLRTSLEIVIVAAALVWLDPRSAALTVALAAAMLLIPLAAQPAVAERDLRMRNHAGALGRFYLDALLGLVAVRTHGAEPALAREHEDRLREWVRAARAALRAALAAEAVQALVGFGLAIWLLVGILRTRRRARRGRGAAGRLLGAVAADARLRAGAARAAGARAAQPDAASGRAAGRARGTRRRRCGARARRSRTPVERCRLDRDERRAGRRGGSPDPRGRRAGDRARRARRDRRSRRARASRAWSACCSAGTGPPRARSPSTAAPLGLAELEALAPADGVGRSDGLPVEPLARRQPRLRAAGAARRSRRPRSARPTSTTWCAGCRDGAETPLGEAGGLVSGGEGQRVRFGARRAAAGSGAGDPRRAVSRPGARSAGGAAGAGARGAGRTRRCCA